MKSSKMSGAVVPHVRSDSESDDDRRPAPTTTTVRTIRRQRSIHRLLGGRKGAAFDALSPALVELFTLNRLHLP
jgi:hypothetical protein